jgi:hypothetical protein
VRARRCRLTRLLEGADGSGRCLAALRGGRRSVEIVAESLDKLDVSGSAGVSGEFLARADDQLERIRTAGGGKDDALSVVGDSRIAGLNDLRRLENEKVGLSLCDDTACATQELAELPPLIEVSWGGEAVLAGEGEIIDPGKARQVTLGLDLHVCTENKHRG